MTRKFLRFKRKKSKRSKKGSVEASPVIVRKSMSEVAPSGGSRPRSVTSRVFDALHIPSSNRQRRATTAGLGNAKADSGLLHPVDMGDGDAASASSQPAVNRELNRKITQLESSLSEHKASNKALQDEIVQLKFQLSVLRDDILDTEELIKRTKQAEKEKNNELLLMKRDHESLKYKCQGLEKQIEYRDAKLNELGVFITPNGLFEQTSSSASNQANTSNDSILSEDDVVSKQTAEINSLKLDLQLARTQLQNLEKERGTPNSVNHLENGAANGGGGGGNHLKKISELEYKNIQLAKDRDFYQNNYSLMQKAKEREESKNKEAEEREKRLNEEVTSLRKGLKKLQREHDEVQQTNSQLQKRLEKHEKSKKGVTV